MLRPPPRKGTRLLQSGLRVAHTEQRADVRHQLPGLDGLDEVRVSASLQPGHSVLFLYEGGGNLQDGNGLGALRRFQAACHFEAADIGKVHVEKHEVGPLARRQTQRIFAGPAFHHLEPMLSQRSNERVSERGVVVDDENTGRRHGLCGSPAIFAPV